MREYKVYTVLWEHKRGKRGDLMGLPGSGQEVFYRYPVVSGHYMEPKEEVDRRVGQFIRGKAWALNTGWRNGFMVFDRRGNEIDVSEFVDLPQAKMNGQRPIPVGEAKHELRRQGHEPYGKSRKVKTSRGTVLVFETDHGPMGIIRIGNRYDVRPMNRSNPKVNGVELYDPREESVRAVTQAIYERTVKSEAGRKSNSAFRNRAGRRLDVETNFFPNVYGLRTAVAWKRGRLFRGSQDITAKTIRESRRRYGGQDPQNEKNVGFNHLLNNRQSHEETLGLMRKGGFYRVTKEETKRGPRYFVWPLRPKQFIPHGYKSVAEAKREAAHFNKTADPRRTKRWWTPHYRKVTAGDLSGWLPPESAFRQLKLIPQERVSTKKGKVKKEKMDGRVVYKVYVGSIWTGQWAASPEKANKMARRAG